MDTTTKLIVGLGNPGKEYQHTRHNIGFDTVDALAARHGIVASRRDFRALTGDGRVGDSRVYLIKPQTYMNLSGESLALFLRQKPLPIDDILVITDDIALPVGRIRLRSKGSAGGHNGLKSIIAHLHSSDFARLRVGVGAPDDSTAQIDFVLGRFSKTEREEITVVVDKAVEAIESWIADGVEAAMNRFNRVEQTQ
jgi:PTH1 family peptidyl-tRNA hydrolase